MEDSTGLVWDFNFECIQDFEISADCVLGFFIDEVIKGDKGNEVFLRLHNGILSIVAEKVSLGIPSGES